MISHTIRNIGAVAVAGAAVWTLNKPAVYATQVYIADSVVLPALRLLDPETAHELAITLVSHFGPRDVDTESPILEQVIWGLQFRSPLGLAAGFDKEGRAIGAMLDLGFAFVEVGSVTPQPQAGNPRPRLFRLDADQAVINRYGFNSGGVDEVYQNLHRFRSGQHHHRLGLVGVNAGKNKLTPEENAKDDYAAVISKLGPEADYLVINVSSPNTPGLRGLQQKDSLAALVRHCQTERDKVQSEKWGVTAEVALGGAFEDARQSHFTSNENNIDIINPSIAASRKHVSKRIPLLIKIAPDLIYQDRIDIAAVCIDLGVDGIIVSNSTISRPMSLKSPERSESGGLSGVPVRALSTQLVADMYSLTEGKIPIVGVGGVCNGEDAFEKIAAGASLVQVYTSMTVDGPGIVKKTKLGLQIILQEHGFLNISEAVGSENKRYTSSSLTTSEGGGVE